MGNQKEAEAEAARAAGHHPAGYLNNNNNDIPPPSYNEATEGDFSGKGKAYPPPPSGSDTNNGPSRHNSRFPASLNAYTKIGTRTVHLGETKETPSFALRMHSGFTKNPPLVLHSGATDEGAIVASASTESIWKSSTPVFSVAAHEMGADENGAKQEVKMSNHWSLRRSTYTFEADVGAVGEKTRREQFEWRSSHGSEVRGLDGYKWGWKLVRLSGGGGGGNGGEMTHGGERTHGSSSDGFEVVAAWAHNNSLSLSKAFKFQLMGAALAGELGERGNALALISALWIWTLEMKSSTASSAAVASG